MRLINADKVKAESREHCKTCILNGTKHCDKTCVINLICDRLDLQPTVERVVTTKPAVITDKSGHKKEGYYDESRLIFFPIGYTKEFLDADGITLTIESEQMRGKE